MPAISHLLRFWRSSLRSFRVWATSIPTDDFYASMSLQPFFQSGSFPIRQKINRDSPFEIQQDRSVGFAFAKREIIDTKNPRCGNRLIFLCTNKSE